VKEGMNKKPEEKIRYDRFPSLPPQKKETPIPSSSPSCTMIEDGISTKGIVRFNTPRLHVTPPIMKKNNKLQTSKDFQNLFPTFPIS
jgi:hypothetical protein